MAGMKDMDTIGKRVAYARSIMNWNQTELATEVGIKAQAIQQIEDGSTKRSKYLPDIAEACRVPYKWILDGGDIREYLDKAGSGKPPGVEENTAAYLTASTSAGKEISAVAAEVMETLVEKGFVKFNNMDSKKAGEVIGFAFDSRGTKSVAEATNNVIDYLKFAGGNG